MGVTCGGGEEVARVYVACPLNHLQHCSGDKAHAVKLGQIQPAHVRHVEERSGERDVKRLRGGDVVYGLSANNLRRKREERD